MRSHSDRAGNSRCPPLRLPFPVRRQKESLMHTWSRRSKRQRRRNRRDEAAISRRGLRIAKGKIEAKMDRLLDEPDLHDESLRFAMHLLRYRDGPVPLSRSTRRRRDQLSRRTGNPARSDQPQDLGRESHSSRRSCPSCSDEHSEDSQTPLGLSTRCLHANAS